MDETQKMPSRRIEETVRLYADMLFRICFVMLKNQSDAEDAVQNTFLKYIYKAPEFEAPEHEKAWLIRVASNECKDMRRSSIRHSHTDITAVTDIQGGITDPESCGILEALMDIPEKFRMVLILHYVEGYGVADIAKIIGKTGSAVKMRLQKGRRLLEEKYRREYL